MPVAPVQRCKAEIQVSQGDADGDVAHAEGTGAKGLGFRLQGIDAGDQLGAVIWGAALLRKLALLGQSGR